MTILVRIRIRRRWTGVIQSDAGLIMRYDSLILPKETPMLTTDRDQILLEHLNRHPLLRTRMGRFNPKSLRSSPNAGP